MCIFSDVTLHTIPRVNNFLKHREWKNLSISSEDTLQRQRSLRHILQRTGTQDIESGPHIQSPISATRKKSFHQHQSPGSSANDPRQSSTTHKFIKKCKVLMYNFGSPRVGNRNFAQFYNRICPASYRVVVDGDIVTGLPPSKYKHVGTQILIDSIGAGSIIIDPSFVEKWLRTTMKSSVAVHSLLVYRKGLLGIKLAAEYLSSSGNDASKAHLDPLRLVLTSGEDFSKQVDGLMDENMSITGPRPSPSVENATTLFAASNGGSIVEAKDEVKKEEEIVPAAAVVTEGNMTPWSMITRKKSVHRANTELKAEPDLEDMSPLAIAEKEEQLRMLQLKQGGSKSYLNEESDAKHYAQDVKNMKTVLTQIHSFRNGGSGPIEWLRKKSKGIGTFRQQRSKSTNFGSIKRPLSSSLEVKAPNLSDERSKSVMIEGAIVRKDSVIGNEGKNNLPAYEYKLTNSDSPGKSSNIISSDSSVSDDDATEH